MNKLFKFKYVLILLLLGVFFLFLNYYKNTNTMQDNNTNISQTNIFNKLDEINNTVAYLFFDEASLTKTVNLFLQEDINIENINILNAELYHDDKFVSNRIIINNINNNVIRININEYVEQFNKLKIITKDNSGELYLDVGQYFFEKMKNIDTIESNNKFILESFNTRETINSFEGNFSLIGNNTSKIEIYIPKKLKDLEILNENLYNEDFHFTYTCSIPQEYFYENDLLDISFEVLFYQIDKEDLNNKSQILSYLVTLQK